MANPAYPMTRQCPMSPPPTYAELREQGPAKVDLPDGGWAWLLTSYDDVRQAMNDPRFSSDDEKMGRARTELPPNENLNSFWRMDEPEHGRQRHMMMTEFTAKRIKEWRPRIQKLVDELLDRLETLPRPLDLYSEFALALPTQVIAQLLGVPQQDYRTFAEQSRTILSLDKPEESWAAYYEMNAYLNRLIASREREPQDDLISRLITDRVQSGELSREDLLPMVRFILVSGYETTTSQIALSALTLMTNPEVRAQLIEDPERITAFVEESLRFWSVSQDNVLRVVDQDMTFSGTAMTAGELVILAVPAANHDAKAFPDPERFDLERGDNRHVAFGFGTHLCAGASLARREVEIAITSLLSRLPDIRLVGKIDDLTFRQKSLVYGLERLPVTW
ncbi:MULTISPECIES: cytochrome P450 [Streptomyces]|uniref:Cytochrome P450 n=1 Tax=Streptomyces lasiicapitis TaxID=1923961 RepID=A0ABQ2MYC4_9ACTN|nr:MULTISPECIES: cytochrome P450 [Streptomyces]QIB41701.1 cytochrome P450 [Streptomyces aureoverticillatus]QIB48437.1 cytochrome P450 [Streptomyces aureoverticillatus]GGO59767.1 cytochrome P450 [Streptomyces lasiicapitis]